MTTLLQRLKPFLTRAFDIREGEYRTALMMQGNIFLLISTLLIIKPTINAQFLSEFGAERLPEAFIMVAIVAVLITTVYAKRLSHSSLKHVIELTLSISIVILVAFSVLVYLNYVQGWLLYFFYVWVAIFGVLSASQFWILANMVYNVREAKRLFGFIGAGAISGGIFGGYLTSIIAPLFGSEVQLFIAAFFLILCIPLTRLIWKENVAELNIYKRKKRVPGIEEHPFQMIRRSRHLTYLAGIIGVSVIVAKLVDYQFSDVASNKIEDPDKLASFFGFWFSNFNLISLMIQLFLTRRIVGVWGVGTSLMILPMGVLFCAVSFLVFPELWAAVLIKSMDGSLKQSVNKSAIELLSLPIPAELKNRTKTFIDVVVDSIATGTAGLILIFIVQGADLTSRDVSVAIIAFIALWGYMAYLVRSEYIKLFRSKVGELTGRKEENEASDPVNSVIHGLRKVLASGTEQQLIYMLNKTLEIKESRLFDSFHGLLNHSSPRVRALALENLDLYRKDVSESVEPLIFDEDPEVSLAAFEYLFERSEDNVQKLLHTYLNHQNKIIADNALRCLAIETRDNQSLKEIFFLENRIEKKKEELTKRGGDEDQLLHFLDVLGSAGIQRFNKDLLAYFDHKSDAVVIRALINAGKTMDPFFIPHVVPFLAIRKFREAAKKSLTSYGIPIIDELKEEIESGKLPTEVTRFIPAVIASFGNEKAVNTLFELQDHPDLTLSIEALRSLNTLKDTHPDLIFDKHAIADRILATSKVYQQTLSAMHAQIIISFRKGRKQGEGLTRQEDGRRSLIELLERRLDSDLERIFRLLGLKYPFEDVFSAYNGLKSGLNETRINAIEYLDNLLEANLKRVLIPIIETTIIDVDEDSLRRHRLPIPSELECFRILLGGNDQRIKLAVLHLIGELNDPQYLGLLEKYLESDHVKIRTFAQKAYEKLRNTSIT